jgi:hypothetical protein
MRKLALAIAFTASVALLLAGMLGSHAGATPALPPATHSSPVQAVACGGPGPYCPPGRTRVCGPAGCWCAPCGGYVSGPYWRPWRWRY